MTYSWWISDSPNNISIKMECPTKSAKIPTSEAPSHMPHSMLIIKSTFPEEMICGAFILWFLISSIKNYHGGPVSTKLNQPPSKMKSVISRPESSRILKLCSGEVLPALFNLSRTSSTISWVAITKIVLIMTLSGIRFHNSRSCLTSLLDEQIESCASSSTVASL